MNFDEVSMNLPNKITISRLILALIIFALLSQVDRAENYTEKSWKLNIQDLKDKGLLEEMTNLDDLIQNPEYYSLIKKIDTSKNLFSLVSPQKRSLFLEHQRRRRSLQVKSKSQVEHIYITLGMRLAATDIGDHGSHKMPKTSSLAAFYRNSGIVQ